MLALKNLVWNSILVISFVACAMSVRAHAQTSIDLSTCSGVVTGTGLTSAQRVSNGTALQTCLDNASTAGQKVFSPKVTYEYDAERITDGVHLGLQVPCGVIDFGGDTESGGPTFVQFAADYPVLTLGQTANVKCYGNAYHGFIVQMGTTGTTNSRAVLIGAHFKSRFWAITTGSGSTVNKPYIGWAHIAGDDFFSNFMNTISIQTGQYNLMSITASGTGSVWDNIYLGGGADGAEIALTSYGLYIENAFQGVFNQLNVENVKAPGLIFVHNAPSNVFNSVHLERNILSGASPSLIRVYGATTNSVFHGVESYYNDFHAATPVTGAPSDFSTGAEANTVIVGYEERHRATGKGSVDVALTMYRTDGGTALKDRFEASAAIIGGITTGFYLDANSAGTSYGTVNGFGRYTYHRGVSTCDECSISPMTSPLNLYGNFNHTKVVYASPLTANQTTAVFDRMASSGSFTDGVRPAGDSVLLTRTAAATGSFNVILLSPTSQTITTLGAANSEYVYVSPSVDIPTGGKLGTPPTVASCGGGAGVVTAGSASQGGEITTSSTAGTACTVTFSKAYPIIPFCSVSDYTGDRPTLGVTSSALLVTWSAAVTSRHFSYSCRAHVE